MVTLQDTPFKSVSVVTGHQFQKLTVLLCELQTFLKTEKFTYVPRNQVSGQIRTMLTHEGSFLHFCSLGTAIRPEA